MPTLFDVLIAQFPVAGGYGPNRMPFQVGDQGKGAGPEIVAWDTAQLGPQPTPAQITTWTAAYVPPAGPTLDQIYDQAIQTQQVLKAVILALNDGSLPIGTNKTPAQLKAAIKARM